MSSISAYGARALSRTKAGEVITVYLINYKTNEAA
jgi:hypothetical protein